MAIRSRFRTSSMIGCAAMKSSKNFFFFAASSAKSEGGNHCCCPFLIGGHTLPLRRHVCRDQASSLGQYHLWVPDEARIRLVEELGEFGTVGLQDQEVADGESP